MLNLLLALSWVLPFSLSAQAESVRTKHVTAELVTEHRTLKPGAPNNFVGLRMNMIPHWHTYWRFAGDSGLPTEIVWHLPERWNVGPLLWEMPRRIVLPPLVTYGFEGETLAGARLIVPPSTKPGDYIIRASASWLVCKEECIPEKAELSVRVRVSKERPQASKDVNLFQRLHAQQPQALPAAAAKVVFQGRMLGLEIQGAPELASQSLDFFPLKSMLIKGDTPPTIETIAGRTILWMEKAEPFDNQAKVLPGVLFFRTGNKLRVFELAVPLSVRPAPSESSKTMESASAWILVLLAFLGGLVLNLMPCVFPVLGIKVMSLVRQSNSHPREIRNHGFSYAVGVVVCFWGLATALVLLRSFGEAVGWGFQLQNPMFVTLLILLFTFIAVDLLGYVEWSGRWMGAGSGLATKGGYGGSFFTGVLAVVVATPCTAPFMGTAIGATISQPVSVLILVFTFLGLGLALPFLILCYFPALLQRLPRPGAWMEKLKKIFAIPILGTVIWLIWVLSQQIGFAGALGVAMAAAALALAAFSRHKFTSGPRKNAGVALFVFGIVGALYFASKPQLNAEVAAHGAWAPYSEALLNQSLQQGRPVFVDFTAAWCLTCQINKKLVLDRDSVQSFFRQKGVVLLLADWTNRDPKITQALERQGRLGVPLYLAYRAGENEPQILPQILTEGVVREAFP